MIDMSALLLRLLTALRPFDPSFDFGEAGSLDDLLARVGGVSVSGGPGLIDLGGVAGFAYDGGRLVSAEFGDRHCSGGVHLGAVPHETRAFHRHVTATRPTQRRAGRDSG